MNVGDFFKYLNSDACHSFYSDLTADNKNDVIETMMNDTNFMTTVQEWIPDPAMIRNKLDTNLGQVLKKRSKPETKKEVQAPVKPVVQEENDDADFLVFDDDEDKSTSEDEIISMTRRSNVDDIVQDSYPEYDEEMGKHVGNGYYVKQEGHLMKMTSPEWIVYY